MPLGDIPSTQDPTSREITLYRAASGTLNPGQTYTWQVTQFTMPFTGSLAVRMVALLSWSSSGQYATFALSNSTPAWTNGYGGESLMDSGAGWGSIMQVPCAGWWASLTAGTLVTINGTLYVGGGPTTTVGDVYGYARMCIL